MTESAPGADHAEAIGQLRQRGAERLDPVGFGFVTALAERRRAHTGAVAQHLDGRLAQALAACAQRCERASGTAGDDPAAGTAPSPLAELVAHIARQGADIADGELKALRDFRDDWSRLSVSRRIDQALESAPGNAGPLNSHLLVLRALELMRDTSVDYLDRFVAYVDTLLWLDQANGGTPAKPAAAKRKPGPGRAR